MNVAVKSNQAVLSAILAVALLAIPGPSSGQPPAKIYRVGWLASGLPPEVATPQDCPRRGGPMWQAWAMGLRERGYIQGRNLLIECRYTEGRDERAPALAAELVNLKVDLIVASATNQVRAAKQATTSIPILMYGVIDPVRRGLVSSLARPGGNVTGLTEDAGLEILGKYLELLKEALPRVSRVATLHPPPPPGAAREPATAPIWGNILEAEARALGVTLYPYRLRDLEDLEGAFASMTKARAEALLVVPHPFFDVHTQRIVEFAAQSRLPAMYPGRWFVEAGGLMAYAVDDHDSARRLAAYVDRIFKGAKPGELPVEQPTKFVLILNLKTARALGLTIPSSVLIQAEEVIR